jgi:hypothetical protein
MIMQFKSSIQRESDRFFKELFKEDFNIRQVSKSAFTQARAKLNPEAFQHLNQVAWKSFYRNAPWLRWKDKRILAEDGTRLLLPNHPSIEDEFGSHNFGCKAKAKRSMATATMLYDPLNQVALDASIAPYGGNERELLVSHLKHVTSEDILLLDRGYSCFWLLFLLSARKTNFCVRLQNNWWLKANEFDLSDNTEQLVSIRLPKKDYSKLQDYPEIRETEITVRFVKIPLDNGTHQILCTSLIDSKEYSIDELKALYRLRWNEEEAFKMLKSRIELENFSGKTAIAVKQDFFAKVFLLSITAMYAHPIDQKVKKEYEQDQNDRIHAQKINKTYAVATTQSILIATFIRKLYRKALDAFDKLVYRTREIVRPKRKNPRVHKPKRPYPMNYKHL